MSKNKLHNIKNTGFKVPENYFATLEDNILNEAKLHATITESGFKVPNEYFNALETKLMNNVKPIDKPRVLKLITWQKASYVAAIAASVFLTINIFFNTPVNTTIDTVDTATIENYILNEDLETAEFAALFTNEDLSDVQLINDGFSSETLENYLFDHLEIEDIITK